jgi:hypothetical protein
MKKICLTGMFPLLIGVTMTFCACNNKATSTPVTFDKVAIDTTVNLVPGDTASPKAKINLTYTYAKGAKGGNVKKINNYILSSNAFKSDLVNAYALENLPPKEVVRKFVQEYIKEYRKTCGPLYAKDKTTHSCNYEFLSEGKVVNNGRYSCLTFNKYVYTGGANGMSSAITINVDRKTGEIITKDQLLKQISPSKTKQEIVNSLVRQLKVKDFKQLHDSLYVFSDTTVYIPDNFRIGKDSITFIYGDLEIAPHYMGVLKAKVSKKDIQMKPE